MSTNLGGNLELELKDRPRGETLAATVDNVKRSCFELVSTDDCAVNIDQNRLALFVDELDVNKVKRKSHLMEFPIEFQDLHAEINFHINLHLFNFGHGFRHPLHSICGQGAWQTMKKGITALHLNTAKGFIDARSLITLSAERVNALFGFPSQHSYDDGQKIYPLRDMILDVAHSTGKRLIERGYTSFADFIFDHSSAKEPSAVRLVECLADHFPAFDDRRFLKNGKEVLFLKKAQLAIAELYQNLGHSLASKISFGDLNSFTVACDNVLPCVLRRLGILKINRKLERKIDSQQPLAAGDEEAQLRASAIAATQMMLYQAKGAFWSKELGDYLWTLGKEPQFRKVERHATIDTCFY